ADGSDQSADSVSSRTGLTDEIGVYTFDLPDISALYAGGDLVPRLYIVGSGIFDPAEPLQDHPASPPADLDEESKKALTHYDDGVGYTVNQIFLPRTLLRDDLNQRLLDYGATFYRQLAQNQEDDAVKAVSGVY